jgi:Rps23 Pro-64 3,4-dihydroxylase Tpa1-like proline 4-hydroxylase
MTPRRQVVVIDDFFEAGRELRLVFDDRLGNLRGASPERFVWDYWHVPDQYTYVRTFADEFFPRELFGRLLDRLLTWGGQNLACTKVVRPWLSYYVDGCRQEMHADVPHGPWAYVFSLTNWEERAFTGGETFLLGAETLDLWRSGSGSAGSELESFVELIEPKFNRLTVFDPRIPHGVRQVEGTREPRDSRLAIHSWFYEPRLVVSEALERAGQRPELDAVLAILLVSLRDLEDVEGLVATRVDIDPRGGVGATRVVSSSLVSTSGDGRAVEEAERSIEGFLADSTFPKLGEDAWAVFPVQFPITP